MTQTDRFHNSLKITLAAAAMLLAATSCRNPLVGMGARVDLNPPQGDVTGIVNGDYVNGPITLTGTIEDDKEVQGVSALINGVTVPGTVNPDGTWEIDIDTADDISYGGDGEKDILISLIDTSGKVTEKQMLLFFDNTPPVLMVTTPDLVSPIDTTPFTIRGEAYDPLRLSAVRATVGQGSINLIGSNDGTSDSWLFEIDHSVLGTEELGIILEAEDQAGNVSQAVFHSKDLRFLNNDESITVIELYNLTISSNGDPLIDYLTITPDDVDDLDQHTGLPSGSANAQLKYGAGSNPGLPINVDMSGDIPQITVTTPNPLIPAPGDTMGPASKVNGTVADNVDVDETTIEIRFLDEIGDPLPAPDDVWSNWTAIDTYLVINDQNVNFSHSLPGTLPDANYVAEVRADDTNGTTGQTAQIPFRLDGNAPVIEITAPALSSYIANTSLQIEGTATDSEDITVEISLDSGATWDTVGILTAPGGAWSYTISDWEAPPINGTFTDFDTIPVSARATANGTTTYTNHSLILDRVAPTIEFLTPPDGRDSFGDITGDVNGVVTLRVAVSDDSLDSVTHKIGTNGPVQAVDSGSIYNWSEIIVTTLMEDPNLATEISTGIWELPVTVTATDKAGNSTVSSDYSLIIDNAQDRPNVSLIYPIEGQSYGGEVVVSGIATDDDGTVGAVYVQVDLDTPPLGTPDFATNTYAFTDGIMFDGSTPVTLVDETVAYQVAGLSSWSFALNTTGELYSTDAFGGSVGHDGDIYVRVWAEDPIDPTVTSVPQVLHFRLDDTLPRIDSVEIDGQAVTSNQYVSGTINLDVDTSDDTLINKLEISYDNGVSWNDEGITPAMAVSHSVPIDTAAQVSGGNGILYLRLKATDNTGYTTLEVLPLNVDNNAPEGTYPGTEPIILNGNAALLQGTASDPNGSIAGVDRIEVYLERNGGIYNPQSGAYDYDTNYYPDIAAEETTFGAGNYYPVDPAGAGVMIIDDVNELGDDTVSGDGDGYDESLTLVASTWNWWVKFDSENIPDGDINIRYVVVDKAGNKAHYAKAARIENNPPVIESVILGTDINYNAAVDTTVGDGESFRYIDGTGTDGSGIFYTDFNILVSTITTRNSRLWIDADEKAGDGNGDPLTEWTWELLYKGGGGDLLGGSDSVMITDFTGMPDEASVSYILRVTDDAGLTDEVELIINLDNTDDTDPTVSLTPLTVNYSSIIDARGGAGNNGYPTPGYDPSETPLWGSAEGRLRPAGVDEYDGNDADVSGKIIVSGIASDDKTLHQVSLTIDDYNGGLGAGNPFVILSWDAAANGGLGGLIPAGGVIGTPHVSSESYGESAGHVVSWSFEFNTAAITNGARDDIQISAEAQDKSSRTSAPEGYTVDVMPFISTILLSDSGYVSSTDIIRSRYGAWSIPEDSYLIIRGFNLGGTVGMVSSDAGDSTIPDLLDTRSDFTGSTVSGDRTQVTGQAAGISYSGWLVMETNNVPLMNYYGTFDENDFTSDYWTNDGLWNDDRYLDVWDTDHDFYNLADSGFAVWGSMATNPQDGVPWASWTDYTTSQIFLGFEGMTAADHTGATTYDYDNSGVDGIFYGYDPSEFTEVVLADDGTPYVSYLANFFGGNATTWYRAGGLVLFGMNADSMNNFNIPGFGSNDGGGDGELYDYDARDANSRVEEVERFAQDQRLWQFRNHRMTVANETGEGNHIYMTYYDDFSKALKFAHFLDDGTDIHNVTFEAKNGTATDDPFYIMHNHYTYTDTGANDDTDYANSFNAIDPAEGDLNIIAGTQSSADSNDKGYWSDITTDTNGNPVVVYLDTWNSTLNLAVTGSRTPLNHSESGGDWVTVSDISNLSTVGYYPSVKVDSTGRIHIIAYRVLSGDILYFSAASIADAVADNFDVRDHIIDSSGNVGAHADLDLWDDVPVITYMNGAYSGTYAGLKYAYLKEYDWGAGTVADTIEWEHGTAPLVNLVNSARLSISGPPRAADNYRSVIGFHSDTYNYVRLRKELP